MSTQIPSHIEQVLDRLQPEALPLDTLAQVLNITLAQAQQAIDYLRKPAQKRTGIEVVITPEADLMHNPDQPDRLWYAVEVI